MSNILAELYSEVIIFNWKIVLHDEGRDGPSLI